MTFAYEYSKCFTLMMFVSSWMVLFGTFFIHGLFEPYIVWCKSSVDGCIWIKIQWFLFMKICWKQLVRYLCIVPMIAYVCCWRRFVEVFKSCEGRKEQGLKNGWVSLQQHSLIYFSSYSFTFTLLDCFLLYKKFTPNSTTSSNVTRALKASWRVFYVMAFLFPLSHFVPYRHHFFSSQANPFLSFLSCII